MSDQEMAAEGVYRVEAVTAHRKRSGRWELLTRWVNYAEETRNPLHFFISRFKTRPGQFMEETACEYVNASGQQELQEAMRKLLDDAASSSPVPRA